MSSPVRLILVGFLLEVLGFALPFLMVVGVITPTFVLAFISFGASVAGVFLGFYGAAMYTVGRRRSRRDYFHFEE